MHAAHHQSHHHASSNEQQQMCDLPTELGTSLPGESDRVPSAKPLPTKNQDVEQCCKCKYLVQEHSQKTLPANALLLHIQVVSALVPLLLCLSRFVRNSALHYARCPLPIRNTCCSLCPHRALPGKPMRKAAVPPCPSALLSYPARWHLACADTLVPPTGWASVIETTNSSSPCQSSLYPFRRQVQ